MASIAHVGEDQTDDGYETKEDVENATASVSAIDAKDSCSAGDEDESDVELVAKVHRLTSKQAEELSKMLRLARQEELDLVSFAYSKYETAAFYCQRFLRADLLRQRMPWICYELISSGAKNMALGNLCTKILQIFVAVTQISYMLVCPFYPTVWI